MCLKKDGFTVLQQDESFFVLGDSHGRKYWSLINQPIYTPYINSHQKVVAYGAITQNGQQFFRTHNKFNAETFLVYLKQLHKHFGKIAVVLDRAPQHRACIIKQFLKQHKKDIRLIYLPTSSPYLNAIKECWHRAKLDLLVCSYYSTIQDMNDAVSEYCRVKRFHLDIERYMNRVHRPVVKNF